jgi:hypothetical protein
MCTRLRFGLAPPRAGTAGLVTALLVGGLTAENASPQSGNNGCCPQSSGGWVLFEDCNPRVPDFWKRDSVAVDVIEVCRHGINFYFVSEEDGQLRYVALIIVKPTRELYETRVIRKIGDPPLEIRLERAKQKYVELVSTLGQLFGVAFCPEGRVDFTKHPLESRPLISPTSGLTLRWRGSEVKLRGYLDVYMTMFT